MKPSHRIQQIENEYISNLPWWNIRSWICNTKNEAIILYLDEQAELQNK